MNDIHTRKTGEYPTLVFTPGSVIPRDQENQQMVYQTFGIKKQTTTKYRLKDIANLFSFARKQK